MDPVDTAPAEAQADAPAEAQEGFVTQEAFTAALAKQANDMQAQFGRVFKALEATKQAAPATAHAEAKADQVDPFAEERQSMQAQFDQLKQQKQALELKQIRQGLVGVMRERGVNESMIPMAVDSVLMRHGSEFQVADNGLGESSITRKAGEFADPQDVNAFVNEYLAGNAYLIPPKATGNIPEGEGRSDLTKISMSDFAMLSDAEQQSGNYDIYEDFG